jgi:hypothetical protein
LYQTSEHRRLEIAIHSNALIVIFIMKRGGERAAQRTLLRIKVHLMLGSHNSANKNNSWIFPLTWENGRKLKLFECDGSRIILLGPQQTPLVKISVRSTKLNKMSLSPLLVFVTFLQCCRGDICRDYSD